MAVSLRANAKHMLHGLRLAYGG